MGKILTTFVWVVALMISLSACNTSGCTDNQSSLPYAGFYSSADGQPISVDSLDIYGVGVPGDSLLYAAGTVLSNVYLPFRSTSDVTSYCFHYAQRGIDDIAYNDTITFTYTSSPYFASEECGAMLQYTIKDMKYTRHLIDSIEITDSIVTNTDIERIKIYFRTSE